MPHAQNCDDCTGMLRTLFSWRRQRAHWVAFWNVEWRQSSFSRLLKMKRKLRSGKRTQREPWSIVKNQKEQHKLPIMSCAPTTPRSSDFRRWFGKSSEKFGRKMWINSCNCSGRGANACRQRGSKAVSWRAGILSVKSPNYISPSPRWMVFVMCSCPVSHVLSYHPMSRNKKNTAPAALPCPVQSVLLPADALPVPVRVHEGPRTSKNPIPPATNLVSRFGGSGNGLSHEPQQKL